MRILTIASEVPPVRSGVAASAGRIIEGARAAGHEVDARSYVDGRTLQRDQIRLSTVGLTLSRADTDDYDLVHLHGPAPSLADSVLLSKRLGRIRTPLVYTHHFTVWGSQRSLAPAYGMYDRGVRRLARAADAVVTTTQAYADHVEASLGRTVEVIAWGVDPVEGAQARTAAPDHDLRVLVLGQMRQYKGHALALEALADVEGIALTLAGGGPLLESLVASSGSVANVEVVGAPDADRVEALYRSHDVILLPAMNVSEAFGIVLVEGMARGCVPLAADLRGVSEVASPTGAVFATGDAAALRRTALAFAQDRERVARLSAASLEAAGAFGWDRTVASYLELYERVGSGT